MRGIQLDYRVKHGFSREFNSKMFGRLSVSYKDKKVYYIPGILDDVPFFRIFNGRVFIGTTGRVDFDPILPYCNQFILSSTTKDNNNVLMKTGKNRLKIISKERGYKIDWNKY